MKLPVFRIDQFEYCVKRMELDSVLDYGTTVRLWTGSWISGLKRGAKVSLALSGLEYELVVQDFSMPHSGGCGGTIDLCDPVLAGKPFEDESFSAEAADTELDAVIKSRVAIAEPLTPMFPAIVASRISLVDVLREICASASAGIFVGGKTGVEVGQLPDKSVGAPDICNIDCTADGWEVSLNGTLPRVGDLFATDAINGTLISLCVTYQLGNNLECRARIGVPDRPGVLRIGSPELLDATVEQLDPFYVTVELPAGGTAAVRAKLYGFQASKGRSKLSMPVIKGDRVIVAWPKGFFAGTLRAFPFGEVPPTETMEMAAERGTFRWGEWTVEAETIDFAVDQEMDIHS